MYKMSIEEFAYGIRDLNLKLNNDRINEIYEVVYGTGNLTEQIINHTHQHTNCLAPCTKAECPAPSKKGCPVKKQEEDNLMNYASASISTPATETQDQRKYLAKRLDEVYRDKRNPLEGTFGLTDDATPQGPKETADRIAAGKFVIRGLDKAERDYSYWSGGDLIQWRDPAKKADQEGFTAAKKDLKAKYQTTLDTIKIDEPKAGLGAIKALEAWEPTTAAS